MNRTQPPNVVHGYLYISREVMLHLGISEYKLHRAIIDGDLRPQRLKGDQIWVSGTDILYYYFKHRKQ